MTETQRERMAEMGISDEDEFLEALASERESRSEMWD
jgi:hypothetical protein